MSPGGPHPSGYLLPSPSSRTWEPNGQPLAGQKTCSTTPRVTMPALALRGPACHSSLCQATLHLHASWPQSPTCSEWIPSPQVSLPQVTIGRSVSLHLQASAVLQAVGPPPGQVVTICPTPRCHVTCYIPPTQGLPVPSPRASRTQPLDDLSNEPACRWHAHSAQKPEPACPPVCAALQPQRQWVKCKSPGYSPRPLLPLTAAWAQQSS